MIPLFETLRSRDPEVAAETEALIKRVVPLLWHSLSTFPDGTSHTPEHTNAVENIASALLPDGLRSELNTTELCFLLLACHFHDLGMAGTSLQNRTETGRDQARREHAIAIGTRLTDNWQTLGFRDALMAEALKEVCRGHRPSRNENGRAHWNDIDTELILGQGKFIRPRLIAALIYAADELHLDAARAPERERQWLQIEGDSKCHWRRHQSIAGPILLQEILLFEVTVETTAFEANLRREVLLKAFGAVRDANDELGRHELVGRLRVPSVKWKRDSLWDLLTVKVCSDMCGRTETEIRDAVYDQFKAERDKFVDLSDVCTEQSSAQEIKNRIDRAVADLKIRSALVASTEANKLELASDARNTEHLLKIARIADDLDNLFLGKLRVTHELQLFNSPFGARFIDSTTVPQVNEVFGVKLKTDPQDSPAMTALRSSPSACAMISSLRNRGSNRVDRHAFECVVLAGAIHDVAQYPHLMLDERFRHKLRELAKGTGKRIPQALRWAEEVALTTGYAIDQFHDLLSISDEMMKSVEPEAVNNKSVHFSQSFSITNPQMNIGPLLLAGRRLGEQVEIRSLPEAQLSFRVGEDAPKPIESIAMGPGDRSFGQVSFVVRGSLDVDEQTRIATFVCHGLKKFPDSSPFAIYITTTPATTTCTLLVASYLPASTIGTERQIDSLNRLFDTGSVEIRVILDGRLFSTQVFQPRQSLRVSRCLGDAAWQKLKGLPDDIPVPPALKRKWDADLAEIQSDPSKIEAMLTRWRSEPIRRTSVTLRVATAMRLDFKESFLGFLPIDREFSPPLVNPESVIPQSEIDQQFERGEIVTGGLFSEDFEQLAKIFEDWAENMDGAFPISLGQEGVPHVLKTEVMIHYLPQIERVTYVERPVLIRLRPLTELEQRKTEFEFWNFRGDAARARLVSEIIDRMESDLMGEGAGI